ncbi:receptor-like serine/threonine-protein kinase ALE2 isoform X2 [Magnolia sinica]|uniref:receptor-like serine/threonine-protein kinase ALE2 isoform X2 n=1 Tax=Magnolia sinica TaxID=86752 RepID=UPI00265A7DAA|nr:receptor-like serine/threonine-protein kinase ALE2 isoform X2 [Magnolia sinica]
MSDSSYSIGVFGSRGVFLRLGNFEEFLGMLKRIQIILLSYLLVSSYSAAVFVDVELSHHISESPAVAPSLAPPGGGSHVDSRITPTRTILPLPVIIPLIHRPYRKHFSPHAAPSPVPVPAPSPHYGSLRTFGHPSSSSSHLSKPSMKRNQNLAPNSGHIPPAILSGIAPPPLVHAVPDCCGPGMVQRRGSRVCHCVYPIKLELLLLNASFNSNWSTEFLGELASQLRLRVSQFEITNFYLVGLSSLNITMDIAPHIGISFSSSDVYTMNSSLSKHKVHLDTMLVGDYKLLNFTWFKPPAPSPAPAFILSPTSTPPDLLSIPPTSRNTNKGKRHSLILILGIGIGILIIVIISVVIIYLCMSGQVKKKATAKETVKERTINAVSVDGSLRHPTSTRFLSYEELREATNNFETASMLGEGGFGRVFKGVLSDGTPVAIKKLTRGGHQGDKEFLVEVEMLSRLHHRNLVKLVGYYSNRDSSQNLLCYELVPNGSLEAWLHGPLGANCPLDWDTRMKIALDAARGLAYLHEDSQPCVIHRDFKASNILLENDFHAKVADFGLAKLAPEGRANYLSTRVMGTFGYVAPEYAMTGHLLVKSDVYSYGVVLLELLTGRKPVDMSQPSGQENLVTWARPILRDKDRLEELADPKLGCKYPKDDFVRVCTIAAACVALEASQRPTMGEVVQSLKMVQRVTEFQDSSSTRPNLRQSSTTYESDGTSSMFSSGPFSGLSTAFDNENISRTAVFSEDLHEGR